jgi:integrase
LLRLGLCWSGERTRLACCALRPAESGSDGSGETPKGVRQKKAIHALRKESGSLIASNYGIEAARQHLGHRDIRTTSSHYVDKKKRIEVKLPIGTSAHLRVVGN